MEARVPNDDDGFGPISDAEMLHEAHWQQLELQADHADVRDVEDLG